MRMQNVEMEFVTFDAQDVIATSVPIVGGKGIYGTGTVFHEYNVLRGYDYEATPKPYVSNGIFNNGSNATSAGNKVWFFDADGNTTCQFIGGEGGVVDPTGTGAINTTGVTNYIYANGGADAWVEATGENALDTIRRWVEANVKQ